MYPFHSTRVGLVICCLVTLLAATYSLARPAAIHPVASIMVFSGDKNIPKPLSRRGDLPTPTRKPVRKRVPQTIQPLKTLPLHPMTSRLGVLVSVDPIRFTLRSNTDSLVVSEEVELTIQADLLPIPPSLLFFFEDQKSFSLKLLLPDGFVQTGGNYADFIGDRLAEGSKTSVSYTLRGHFTHLSEAATFTLLRGPKDGDSQSLFEKKGTLVLYPRTNPDKAKARMATAICDVDKALRTISYYTVGGVNKVQVNLKPTIGASVEFSLNNRNYQLSSIFSPTATQGLVYLRYTATPTCVAAFPYNMGPFLNNPNKASNDPNNTCVPLNAQGTERPFTIMASSTRLCGNGSSVTLSTTSCSGTVTWISRSGSQTIAQGTGPSMTTNVAGNYWASCTCNGCTCSSFSDAINIVQGSTTPPPAPAVANSALTGCTNTTLILGASGCTANGYRWTNGGVSIQGAVTETLIFTDTATPGIKNVGVACFDDCGGTSASKPIQITLVATPATPSASDLTICSGTSTYLTASNCTGSYRWYTAANSGESEGDGGATFPTGTLNPVGNFPGPGQVVTYSYVRSFWVACESSSGGCLSPLKQIYVTLKPALTPQDITVTHNATAVCPGGTINFTLNNVPPGSSIFWPFPTSDVASRYSIVTKSGQVKNGASSSTQVSASGLDAKEYQVGIANEGYCTAGPDSQVQVRFTIAYKPPLQVSIVNNSGSLCGGQSATLTASVIPNTETATYTWSEIQTSGLSPKGTGATIELTNGNYQVLATPPQGSSYCSNTAITTVYVYNDPQGPTLSINDNGVSRPSASILASQTATLQATACVNSIGETGTITWAQVGGSFTAIGNNVPVFPPVGTYVYSASCTIRNCTALAMNTVTLTVTDPCPTSIGISGNRTVCGGVGTDLTVTGCDNASIKWNTGEQQQESITVSPTVTTVYSVTCQFSGPCQNTFTASATLTPVNFALSPSASTTTCVGNSLTLTTTGCPGPVTWTEQSAGQKRAIQKGNKSADTFTNIISPTTVGQITYQASCAVGSLVCTQQVVVYVQAPAITLVALNNGACGASGASLTYTATDLVSLLPVTLTNQEWRNQSGTLIADPNAVPVGTYTLKTLYSNCVYTASTQVDTSQPGQPQVSGPTAQVCPGQLVSLTATNCNTATTEWMASPGGTVLATGAVSSLTVLPNQATFYARCRRNAQCVGPVSGGFGLNLGTFTGTASAPKICNGNSVTLTTSCCAGTVNWVTSGVPSLTYADTGSRLVISPTATTTFQAFCLSSPGTVVASSSPLNISVTTPISFAPVVSCGGTPVKGTISPTVTGNNSAIGLSMQYQLKRWNGTTMALVTDWSAYVSSIHY